MSKQIVYNTGTQQYEPSSIRLTLEDGRIIPFNNDEESLNTEGMLCALFNGETSAREGKPVPEDWDGEEDYICLHDEIWENNQQYYVKVVSAKWSFSSTAPFGEYNDFKQYIENWMNENEWGIKGIFNLLQEGCESYGPTELTNTPRKILIDYMTEIECITDELCEDMGMEFWCVFEDIDTRKWNLDLSKLVVIAFEETVRREAINELQIDY